MEAACLELGNCEAGEVATSAASAVATAVTETLSKSAASMGLGEATAEVAEAVAEVAEAVVEVPQVVKEAVVELAARTSLQALGNSVSHVIYAVLQFLQHHVLLTSLALFLLSRRWRKVCLCLFCVCLCPVCPVCPVYPAPELPCKSTARAHLTFRPAPSCP